MTLVLGLFILVGIALGVYLSFFRSLSENRRRDSSDPIVIHPAVPLGMPTSVTSTLDALESKRRFAQLESEARVVQPQREMTAAPRTPRVTDPLERYKRRYGFCGRFSRRARRNRQKAAQRALEDAIRRQDVLKLEILHAIGVR